LQHKEAVMNLPLALLVAVTAGAAPLPQGDADDGGPSSPLRSGAVEISTAMSFSSSRDEGSDESISLLNLPVRAGYFVTRRLELEAEALLTRVSYDDDSSTGYQVGGHALYHFGEGRVVPFVLAGASVGDSADIFGVLLPEGEETVTSLRAGAGVKAFLGRRAALRAEYRFVRYSLEGIRFDPGSFEERVETVHPTQHRVFVGISLVF
jgi:hypothetical protein